MWELQRLQFAPKREDEGVRLCRELWEILRRKKGCLTHRLYRAEGKEGLWLVCSEWESLAELAGARRELARSPLYRRLHSMLSASSERAYEPFGAVRSSRGAGGVQAMLVIDFETAPDDAEKALDFLREAPGYLAHIEMRQAGESATLRCIALFGSQQDAASCAQALAAHPTLHDFGPSAELFLA